jgi:hypothetical protein
MTIAINGKPKPRSFRIHGNVSWKKALILAVCVFAAFLYSITATGRAFALSQIPRVDNFTEHGLLKQTTGYTCVPATMAMFFHDEGVDASSREIARLAGTWIGGTSEKGGSKAAKYFGYSVATREFDFKGLCDFGRPVIIQGKHNGINHVSYIRCHPDKSDLAKLEVLDPLDGRMVLTEGGFYEYYGDPGSKKKCFVFEKL